MTAPSGGGFHVGSMDAESHSIQLKSSARMVTACLTQDEQQIPDPWDLLQSSYSRDYLPQGSPGETHLQVRQVYVIPDILLAQVEGKDCKCFMGLFAEIGRVWLTVENKLYLWDYATGRDYTCFDEIEQVIIDVALVKPRHGVFVSTIKHLLVIVTAAEVIIIGISFTGPDDSLNGDLIIHKTGLVFPSDDINMLSIAGSRSGRIFCGGQDGNIYELAYQAEEGWFTRKCRKINKTSSPLSYFTPTFFRVARNFGESSIISLICDRERNLLYTLSEDSAIQVYYLGNEDGQFENLSRLDNIYEQASRLCPTGVINRKGFKIVSIHVVDAADSAYIHLVAITNSAIKLYFTTLRRDERAFSRPQMQTAKRVPSTFELVHVRLPSEDGRPRDARRLVNILNPHIHTGFYNRGVFVMASAVSDHEDIILISILNQSIAFSSNRLTPLESLCDLPLEGKVWDISEIKSTFPIPTSNSSSSFMEVYSPLACKKRTFLLLANSGIYLVDKTTPIDELQKILIDTNGNMESETLKQFFNSYAPDQACFLATVLACTIQSSWKSFNNGPDTWSGLDPRSSASLTLWAVGAMLKWGGEPRVVETPLSGIENIGLGNMLNPLGNFGNRVQYEYSSLHRGLYTYFARLVSSFWNVPVLRFNSPPTEILMAMHTFAEFLDRNPNLLSRIPSATHIDKSVSAKETFLKLEEAYHAESSSLRFLSVTVKHSLELISFLSICVDYNILEVAFKTYPDLEKVEFEELLVSRRGRELVADIGSALVQKQLKMRSSVDSICQVLVQRCPSFFGTNEVVIYQGTECLDRALQTMDPSERQMQLSDSLKLFMKGASSLSLPVLTEICRKYQRLAFFPGVIDLCLTLVPSIDPDNFALLNYLNPNIQLSTNQQEVVNLRDGIYNLTFETLKAVHGIDARTVSVNVGNLNMDKIQKETLIKAIRSKDELFHLKFYEWIISENLSSSLLEFETPFLEKFLMSKFAAHIDSCKDLLWKYYARHGRYLEASKVLYSLATLPEFSLNLSERIERLSLALGNARSDNVIQPFDISDFILDLEERLDVAKLQGEILEQVISQYGEVSEVDELNSTLFDISQLFNRFTRPLKLSECSLRILHCSSYQDPLLAHQLWTNILERSISGGRFEVLSQKLAELVKKLYPSPYAFPLNFVLDSIMLLAIKHKQPTDWVTTTFIHSGIPVRDILEQIVEFTRSPSPYWNKTENKEYLVEVFMNLSQKASDRYLVKSKDLNPFIDTILKQVPSTPFTPRLNQLKELQTP